jgi:hypothetical protein
METTQRYQLHAILDDENITSHTLKRQEHPTQTILLTPCSSPTSKNNGFELAKKFYAFH